MSVNNNKTLNSRVIDIEKKINTVHPFEPSFISHIHEKEEKKNNEVVQRRYSEIKNQYKTDIKKWVDDPIKQFTKVVEFTVHFVENYSPVISDLFGVALKGNGKLEFAIELIQLVISSIQSFIDNDFIKNSIDHFVIIMNERKSLTNNDNKSNDKKKNKFSLFRRNSTDIQ